MLRIQREDLDQDHQRKEGEDQNLQRKGDHHPKNHHMVPELCHEAQVERLHLLRHSITIKSL